MQHEQETVELSVEVDPETARALDYIARFHGCTVEELVENYLAQMVKTRTKRTFIAKDIRIFLRVNKSSDGKYHLVC